MSLAWAAYRAVAPVLAAAAPAARLFASAGERTLWEERLGRVAAAGPVDAWVHASSLGEALAVAPLLRALRTVQTDARFHLTATTIAGRARLAELGQPHSLAPLDAPQTVTRFLASVRPRRLFLIETELWPHWLLCARSAGIPVGVLSARLSARSLGRYARLGAGFRGLVAGLGGVLCQSRADQARWLSLGATAAHTTVVGNLKDDALPGPAADREAARAGLGLDPRRPLLVLGSLRPGEVRLLAQAWGRLPAALRASWQVVAVPRHPRASAELRAEAAQAGQALVGDVTPAGGAWRWDSRLGVLAGYYAVADVAVVGGSFAPLGGHNPLEPAACGAPVLVGPRHWAQADAVEALVAAGGGRVVENAPGLTAALVTWLGDDAARAKAGAAAQATVRDRCGAADRAVARLAAWQLWPAA
jgi:3-deoxy-D-manno-octulosonic-acid transferase